MVVEYSCDPVCTIIALDIIVIENSCDPLWVILSVFFSKSHNFSSKIREWFRMARNFRGFNIDCKCATIKRYGNCNANCTKINDYLFK